MRQFFASVARTALRALVVGVFVAAATPASAQATRSFTYQGVLTDNPDGLSGVFILYELFRTETGGPRIGLFEDQVTLDENGQFVSQLDFSEIGSDGNPVFNGGELYLQITVQNTVLTPRQRVTPAPIAHAIPGAYLSGGALRLGTDVPNVFVGDQSGSTSLRIPNGQLIAEFNGSTVVEATSPSTIGTWVVLDNTSAGGRRWALISSGSANGEGPGRLVLSNQTTGIAPVVISPEGNVGIGTTAPTERLDVAGAIRIRGADIVEGFDSSYGGAIEPGTVVSIDATPGNEGELTPSTNAYDTKVAGVVSGAGGIPYGMALMHDGQLGGDVKVAMTGRVYVKCSAEAGPIRPGDLLTTAGLGGHAMRAADRSRAHGAVIGKAMSSLDEGTGLVLVLVNLQ